MHPPEIQQNVVDMTNKFKKESRNRVLFSSPQDSSDLYVSCLPLSCLTSDDSATDSSLAQDSDLVSLPDEVRPQEGIGQELNKPSRAPKFQCLGRVKICRTP